VSYDHYSRVWAAIWLEPWTEDMRTVAFYLLTGPHRRSEGIYRLPLGYAVEDLKWTTRRFRSAFDGLVDMGFVEYDEDAKLVLIVNALKREGFNGKQIEGIVKALAELPPSPLVDRFTALARSLNESLAKALADANGSLAHATTNN
jgi:hypothetical protein